MRYRFVNVFPKAMSAVPVAYGSADILKVNVSFNFDLYSKQLETPINNFTELIIHYAFTKLIPQLMSWCYPLWKKNQI